MPSEIAILDAVRARTPARLLEGRAGPAYRTATALALRADHAAARDAVLDEMEPLAGLLEVRSRCASKAEYLLRPDLGRQLAPEGREALSALPRGAGLQVFVGDGLSAAAVRAQVPVLLPALLSSAEAAGWSVGVPFL